MPTMTLVYWVPYSVTATHTLETVILVYDSESQIRTTTQTNTEIDKANFTKPANLNDQGTQVYRVTDTGGGATFDL